MHSLFRHTPCHALTQLNHLQRYQDSCTALVNDGSVRGGTPDGGGGVRECCNTCEAGTRTAEDWGVCQGCRVQGNWVYGIRFRPVCVASFTWSFLSKHEHEHGQKLCWTLFLQLDLASLRPHSYTNSFLCFFCPAPLPSATGAPFLLLCRSFSVKTLALRVVAVTLTSTASFVMSFKTTYYRFWHCLQWSSR